MAWILADCSAAITEISSPAWGLLPHGSLHAVVNAITHIHIKPPRLTKQGFVAGAAAAAITVAGRLGLAIRLRFHNHAPQQLASGLALHQQAADEVGCDQLCGAGEEALGEGGEGFYG